MRAKPFHDPNPFSSGAFLSKDQDTLKEHLWPAPSPLPGLTEYETEGPQGVLWETGWASAHRVPETRGPALFREFGSLLTVHALTQNNTLWHSWDHHNYKDEDWRDYFSMSKRKSPGVGPSWVWACLTIIILPKFLGRINSRICCISHLFPVGPSLLGKPHVGGIATHKSESSSLAEERQCSGNSQRMEEWRRKATTYKLYATRLWVLFSLKNISTFPNCLE